MARQLRQLQLAAVEEIFRRQESTMNRRRLRDTANPFEVDDEEFSNYFHVPKAMAMYLCEALEPVLLRTQRRGLAVHVQVLVTLRFMAGGGYQRGVGRARYLAISQPSVSICIKKVTNAIVDRLLPEWIVFPKTRRKWTEIGERFQPIVKFPGVVGAIGCAHMAIVTPLVDEDAYKNHKGFHSFNVQMICDDQMRILNISVFPGSVDDQFIWTNGSVKKIMKEAHDKKMGSFYIIGDTSYELEPWLLTPLPHASEGTAEYRYTQALFRARSVVDRLYGALRGQWKCLIQESALQYQPKQASTIISACAVLHNILAYQRIPPSEENVNENEDAHPECEENSDDMLQEAKRIQGNIIQQYFSQ
ncbi:putative nuclease HARBI1 [Hetaerina americana]|uniref:putative nuclease HARBI1 n=1 Tax=Hetaerina americana TaxID=62018 RepID=UPI003A7F1105